MPHVMLSAKGITHLPKLISKRSMFWPFLEDFLCLILPKIQGESVGSIDLSGEVMLQVPQVFFNTLNPFMHLEMQFKQQKIAISSKFVSLVFVKKSQNIEKLDDTN
jgi:hypothetical protein